MSTYNNILFITAWDGYGSFFSRQRALHNIKSESLYKRKNFFTQILLFFGVYFFPPLLFLTYGNWKKNIFSYDLVIIDSRISAKYAVLYIKKHSSCRLIVWYWNLVTRKEIAPSFCKKNGAETWTFDLDDAKKYGMSFNDTYYDYPSKDNFIPMKSHFDPVDVFYVGIDSDNRIEILKSMAKIFDLIGVTYYFHLTKSPRVSPTSNYFYKQPISYYEVINRIQHSKVIVDLTRSGQSGLTLRPLESLFYGKKLITNNWNIVNYNVYSKENVFIWGKDNINDLKLFISSVSKCEDKEKMDYYCFENWLSRIVMFN